MVQEAERKWEVEVITFHTRTVDIKKKKKVQGHKRLG